jgi:ribosomal protein S16
MIRVALNGFGRTARTFFRIVHKDPRSPSWRSTFGRRPRASCVSL